MRLHMAYRKRRKKWGALLMHAKIELAPSYASSCEKDMYTQMQTLHKKTGREVSTRASSGLEARNARKLFARTSAPMTYLAVVTSVTYASLHLAVPAVRG